MIVVKNVHLLTIRRKEVMKKKKMTIIRRIVKSGKGWRASYDINGCVKKLKLL